MSAVESLFEGVCPVCEADVEIIEVSGTPSFLREFTYTGEFETRIWEPSCGPGEDGVVRFKCPAGHEHGAYHLSHGDWVA